MAGQKGRDILLKIGDGGQPESFVTIGGLRAKTIALAADSVDATDSDSVEAWRELLSGAGVKSATVTGAGLFKDSASDALAREAFFAQRAANWQLILPDFGVLSGRFLISNLEYSGDYDAEARFSLTLASAGPVAFTAI